MVSKIAGSRMLAPQFCVDFRCGASPHMVIPQRKVPHTGWRRYESGSMSRQAGQKGGAASAVNEARKGVLTLFEIGRNQDP